MMKGPPSIKPNTFVCQSCTLKNCAPRLRQPRPFPPPSAFERPLRRFSLQLRRQDEGQATKLPQDVQAGNRLRAAPGTLRNKGAQRGTNGSPAVTLARCVDEVEALIRSDTVPREADIMTLLRSCQTISELLVFDETRNTKDGGDEDKPNSALLDLEEDFASKKAVGSSFRQMSISQRQRAIDSVSDVLNKLLMDPKVFISTDILSIYVKNQSLLGRPDYLPKMFDLYANKPVPKPGSLPIVYRRQNPNTVRNAIPTELAYAGLEAAIAQKNLPLALAVIDTSFCTSAFYRWKIVRKAGGPITALALTPAVAYGGARYFAETQESMDPTTAMGMAFAGILTYAGCVAAVGGIAVATANDQMKRVVWAPGLPLRDRWLREEERAAFDKVAVAWGFKDEYRRGEEEGTEWENLREFIGRRGMILDKTDLMEGME